jgi:putative transposase
VDGGIYHVLNRGNAKQKVFFEALDYQAFIDLMVESSLDFSVDHYAFCIMPNHFHFVVRIGKAEHLSEWIQCLMTRHVKRYHKHYGGSGHVWQGRFKSFLVQSDEYLLTVMRYAEANPLRAGFVDSAEQWPWSSHNERIGSAPRNMLKCPPVEMPSNWSEWVNRRIGNEDLAAVRKSVNRQAPYGNQAWREAIIEKFGLESTLRLRGRPWSDKNKGARHNYF